MTFFCRKIQELVRSRKVWIGLSDRIAENVWRFPTNNKIFDTHNARNVFKWAAGQPDNAKGNQNCVWFGYTGDGLMDDTQCDNSVVINKLVVLFLSLVKFVC